MQIYYKFYKKLLQVIIELFIFVIKYIDKL